MFLNPFDLLQSDPADASSIKKERKKLLAQVELEGEIECKGRHIAKADVLAALNGLDDPEKVHVYRELKTRFPELNDFLAFGDLSWFARRELPPFFDKIRAFFAHRYDQTLFSAYRNNDIETIRR
ncbi:MAG: hypothetical protein RMM53_11730, partial [Bacteroidia bacterium]|nr:hypothetical protein [Bacteroidia bacterium]MDW8334876.1 hypothetical protein [Bacteroidia bacterium]